MDATADVFAYTASFARGVVPCFPTQVIMSDTQVFLDTLHASIVDIERWLSGADAGPAALDALLAPFAPRFTVILTDGRMLDFAGWRMLLERLSGAKPGLHITLSDIHVLAADDRHATIAYLDAQAVRPRLRVALDQSSGNLLRRVSGAGATQAGARDRAGACFIRACARARPSARPTRIASTRAAMRRRSGDPAADA